MISLNRSSFMTQMGISSGSCSITSHSRRRRSESVKVVSLDSNGRTGERTGSVMVENKTTNEITKIPSSPSPAVEVEPKSAVGGGAQEAYVEDIAADEQFMTPWSVSVASPPVGIWARSLVIYNISIGTRPLDRTKMWRFGDDH